MQIDHKLASFFVSPNQQNNYGKIWIDFQTLMERKKKKTE